MRFKLKNSKFKQKNIFYLKYIYRNGNSVFDDGILFDT